MWRVHRLSLIRQILYLIVIMLVILLISFTISNSIAERIVEKKVTESASKILLQVEESMMSFYSDMDGISYSLLYSPTIQTYLSTNDILSRILMNNEIISVFSSTLSLKPNIKAIQLYNKEGTLVTSLGEGIGPNVIKPVPFIEYSGLQTNPDRSSSYYTIAVPVYNLKSLMNKDYRGLTLFTMDLTNFKNILQKAKMTENSQFLLLDQNDKIMASADNLNNNERFGIEKWSKDKRYIVQTVTLSRTGWKLISIIPKKELRQELNIVKRLNIATYLVMFCMLCMFLLIFYARILKPVKALMDFMKSYPKKGGQSRFNVVYHNEIGVLAGNLNQMLDDMETLSRDIQIAQKRMYEIEIGKKQMEISAFRNQINPHFLYNTLECIRAMALFYKVEEIADISASLSNMFRYAVKGNNFVTVQDELSHLKEYAKIIDFRFRGKIQVAIQADEQLKSERTLKMLLQPIVENAIFHGLEKKIEPGIVNIQVRRTLENEIQYIVQDNGCGMDAHRLDELLAGLQQFEEPGYMMKNADKGIGLANIYRRIKLFYGEQADMDVDSKLNIGTTVRITFPAWDKTEETEDK